MNQVSRRLGLVVRGSLVFLLLALVWQVLGRHSFVYLGTADDYQLIAAGNGAVRLQGSGSGWHWLAGGSYVYQFSTAQQTTQTGVLKVSPFSWRRVPAAAAGAGSHLEAVVHTATLPAGNVGDGYIYVDAASRGVSWRDGSGAISDISSAFGLSTQSSDNYDRVLDIYSLAGGRALVATSSGPYIMTVGGTVNALPQNPDTQDYQAGAYDSARQQLYMLAGYRTVYRYDLTSSNPAVSKVLTTDKNVNRLAAGGGQLLTYYDNVASDQPAAIATYSKLKQVTPVLVNVDAKSSTLLTGFPALTAAVFSGDGRSLGLKSRFAAVMSLYDVVQKRVTATIPAADAGGVAWDKSGLYIGRGGTVWKYSGDGDAADLQPVAVAGDPITRLSAGGAGLLVTTDDQLSRVVDGASTAPVSTSQPVERPVNDPAPMYQYHQP